MPKHISMRGLCSLLGVAAAGAGAGAACSSSGGATAPPLAACTKTSGGQVSLVIAGYTAIDPTQTAGCAVFPANPSASSVQYLVVPQSASSTADDSGAFKLGGNPLTAPPTMAVLGPPAPSRIAELFDIRLRLAERELAARVPAPTRVAPRSGPALVPVDSGHVWTFKVCNVLTCDPRQPSTLSNVTATAMKVGTHIAIYVDNAAPAPLSQSDLDSLRAVFDTRLYGTDTLAFGRESDIDGNGKVVVLMTNEVNSLVSATDCTTKGFVAGYFFGADLITTPPFATGNNAEIFYSIVPDPSATLSCAHTVAGVRALVPVTFVHEFQHMISFNQHFLLRGSLPEDLWLNEGLSHYAEENGGRTFLPDTATFCNYVLGDTYDAGQYFAAPQQHVLVDTAGIGGLAERGAYWLFVRYLVDQLGPTLGSSDSVTRRLDHTALTGAANVSNASGGTPFATIVQRWALANYVSDLSGFTAPPELRYTTWRFRTAFPTIQSRCGSSKIPGLFPLDTATHSFMGSALAASGVLHAGSGSYYLLQQASAAPQFSLLFSDGAGAALRSTLIPRLNVIRLQ
jgi:hypothetical protein